MGRTLQKRDWAERPAMSLRSVTGTSGRYLETKPVLSQHTVLWAINFKQWNIPVAFFSLSNCRVTSGLFVSAGGLLAVICCLQSTVLSRGLARHSDWMDVPVQCKKRSSQRGHVLGSSQIPTTARFFDILMALKNKSVVIRICNIKAACFYLLTQWSFKALVVPVLQTTRR